MIILNGTSGNYPEDPIKFWDFEKYADQASDCYFSLGAQILFADPGTNKHWPRYYFSTEEQDSPRDITDTYFEKGIDKVFTICPVKKEKRQFVFLPFNPAYEPDNPPKIYDVCYAGYACIAPFVHNIINTIKKFNYRFISFNHPDATDRNVSYKTKLNLIAQSKICICHNHLTENSLQLKTRMFEAAWSHSLILCKKDSYGIIEQWFNSNEYVSYENNDLEDKIRDILKNYDKYIPMIDRAYSHVKTEYTIEKFIEKYIGWKNK